VRGGTGRLGGRGGAWAACLAQMGALGSVRSKGVFGQGEWSDCLTYPPFVGDDGVQ
jgi:hypothetical protein